MIRLRKYFTAMCGLLRLCREEFWNGGRIRLQGVHYYIGPGVKVRVSPSAFVDLGKKTWLDKDVYISASGNIQIGTNNYFNSNCKVVAMSGIRIGNNNLFGPNVIIVDHNHRYDDPNKLICEQGFVSAPITIGSNIWIGGNVTICQGVSIADGVIVGANSVVTKSITEPGVYAGTPVKKISDR